MPRAPNDKAGTYLPLPRRLSVPAYLNAEREKIDAGIRELAKVVLDLELASFMN